MPTSAHLELARWLLAREGGNGEDVVALVEAAENACQKLGQRLERLLTFEGFRALMARAIHLANLKYPFLERVQLGSSLDSRPVVLLDTLQGVELARARDAVVMLLATLLGLLVTFIGDELALRLVRDVWPDTRMSSTDTRAREAQT